MKRDWQSLVTRSIPLVSALAVRIDQEDDRIIVCAPLTPNVNDKGTAFGGSIAAIATLTGWCATQFQLDCANVLDAVEIVIQRTSIDYLQPITTDIVARSISIDSAEAAKFVRLFDRRGLARLEVMVELGEGDNTCVRFIGEYVARKVS